MNRIQQILSKAERDGTARRVGALVEPKRGEPDDLPVREPLAPVVMLPREETRRARDEDRANAAPTLDEPFEAVSYLEPSPAAHVSATATLHPILVAALEPMSAAAEQYRSLRSRIAQAENGHALRAIQ